MSLAESPNISLTAEGVETKEEMSLLKENSAPWSKATYLVSL